EWWDLHAVMVPQLSEKAQEEFDELKRYYVAYLELRDLKCLQGIEPMKQLQRLIDESFSIAPKVAGILSQLRECSTPERIEMTKKTLVGLLEAPPQVASAAAASPSSSPLFFTPATSILATPTTVSKQL